MAQAPISWGAARKFVNIFLRDATYCFWLRDAFGLASVEPVLELPLDSFTAKGLRAEPEGVDLPRWPGVIHLTPLTSTQFQHVAQRVAERKRLDRVHLDLEYWRREEAV